MKTQTGAFFLPCFVCCTEKNPTKPDLRRKRREEERSSVPPSPSPIFDILPSSFSDGLCEGNPPLIFWKDFPPSFNAVASLKEGPSFKRCLDLFFPYGKSHDFPDASSGIRRRKIINQNDIYFFPDEQHDGDRWKNKHPPCVLP